MDTSILCIFIIIIIIIIIIIYSFSQQSKKCTKNNFSSSAAMSCINNLTMCESGEVPIFTSNGCKCYSSESISTSAAAAAAAAAAAQKCMALNTCGDSGLSTYINNECICSSEMICMNSNICKNGPPTYNTSSGCTCMTFP